MSDQPARCYFFNLSKRTYVSYNRNGDDRTTWGPSALKSIEKDWPGLPLYLQGKGSNVAPCTQIVYAQNQSIYAFYGFSGSDWDTKQCVEYDYVNKKPTYHDLSAFAPGEFDVMALLSYVTAAVTTSDASDFSQRLLVYQQAGTQQCKFNPQAGIIFVKEVSNRIAKGDCSGKFSYLPIACDMAKAIPGMMGKPVQLKTGLNFGNKTLWFFSDEYCMTATPLARSYPKPDINSVQRIRDAWPGLLDVWPSWSSDVIGATRLGGDRPASPE